MTDPTPPPRPVGLDRLAELLDIPVGVLAGAGAHRWANLTNETDAWREEFAGLITDVYLRWMANAGLLPVPEVLNRVCGCGRHPEGAPGPWGCCRECMDPTRVWFGPTVTLYPEDGRIVDAAALVMTGEEARAHALALLAATRRAAS